MSGQGVTNNTDSGYEFDSTLDNLDALEALLQIKKKTPPNRILSTQPPIAGEKAGESTQFVSSSHRTKSYSTAPNISVISLGGQSEKHCSRTNLGATPSHSLSYDFSTVPLASSSSKHYNNLILGETGLSKVQLSPQAPLNLEKVASIDMIEISLTEPCDHSEVASRIKEALQSRPQRGKKRDNLSLPERLELTRTRNREHAKSTRIRKKARHQELCDRETEWKKYQMKEILDTARRRCVVEFVEFRFQRGLYDDMAKCAITTLSDDPFLSLSHDDIQRLDTKEISSIDELRDGEGHSTIHTSLPRSPPTRDCCAKMGAINQRGQGSPSWKNFVHNDQDFLRMQRGLSSGKSKGDGISSLSQLLVWCLEEVSQNYMNEPISHLSVEIFGDVALGADIGFAQFQVFAIRRESSGKVKTPISLAKAKVSVSSGLIRVEFAPQSSKLTSIELCSYDLEMGRNIGKRSCNPARNSYSTETQLKCIYPTVVSCDLIENSEAPSSKLLNDDEHHDVGMLI